MRRMPPWRRLTLSSRVVSSIGVITLLAGGIPQSKTLECDSPTPQYSTTGASGQRKRISSGVDSSSSQDEQENEASTSSKDDDVPLFSDEESISWSAFSSRFNAARKSLSTIQWSSIGDKIADTVLPPWGKQLPGYFDKVQRELEMSPGSLADEIWLEAQDSSVHPEIARQARVRVSKDLCEDELEFIRRRKRWTRNALASYLDIPVSQIDPRDVPTIAICGSGGGLRALVAGASSYLSAREAGVFDCATYTAGVSGSCWLQALYNSSLGAGRMDRVIKHLKSRIGVHIAYPPSFLELLTRAPTNKYLLSGTVERLKGDTSADFGLVDVYGLLLATRLLVPKDELVVSDSDTKLSNQSKYIKDGSAPMPIYSAVRHEIPVADKAKEEGVSEHKISDSARREAQKESWFQWFEFTPYELWSEEFAAGIPTWSVGRSFEDGNTIPGQSLPEIRIPFLMGIWGSAFCATLSHYYKEIRPLVSGLAGFEEIDKTLTSRDDELVKLHPIDPGTIPNFAKGLRSRLPKTCPESVFKSDYINLMDAGMSNNLPIYPLLREGRDVDIIICFDASADIKQENWLSVVDGYAQQRGIKGWPIGAGWPRADTTEQETKAVLDEADSVTPEQASEKVVQQAGGEPSLNNHGSPTPDVEAKKNVHGPKIPSPDTELDYCNVWVGSTISRTSTDEPPPTKRIPPASSFEHPPNAGITVVYFPLLPNPKVPGVDPETSPFLSTWNFIYTPDEIEKVVELAKANFQEGEEMTKRTVRAVYERKKAKRLEGEKETGRRWWRGGG